MTSGIYKITNPGGKIYIGLSENIENRWKEYKCLSNIRKQKLIYNSMKKYGYDGHKFEVLEVCDIEKLVEREIYWILCLNSLYKKSKLGLNMTDGGNIPPKQNKPMTEEHKLKISLANKGRQVSKETREKIKAARSKQIFTPEQIKKAADSRRGKPSKLLGRKRPNISEKLKGKFSPISKKCQLTNLLTGEIIKANSIRELSRITKISVSSIYKMRAGNKVNKYEYYKFEE